jgi:hypothetical protein
MPERWSAWSSGCLVRSLPKIQRIVGDAARRLLRADGVAFVLREGNQCFYAEEDAIAPLWKGHRLPMRDCVSGWVMLHGEPAIILDVFADDRVPHDAYRPTFVKSLAMVPIRQRDPLGAIGAYWAHRHRPTAEEVEELQALADSSAIANVMAYRELDDSRVDTLRRLALAAEYRDDRTHEHTERVARTSFLVAQRLGLPPSEASLIRQAAPLHDLGKLSLPDAILMKRTRLTVTEYEEVKRHPSTGAAILTGSASTVLRLAEEIAAQGRGDPAERAHRGAGRRVRRAHPHPAVQAVLVERRGRGGGVPADRAPIRSRGRAGLPRPRRG